MNKASAPVTKVFTRSLPNSRFETICGMLSLDYIQVNVAYGFDMLKGRWPEHEGPITTEIKNRRRVPRLRREFPGDVRLHGVRLLRDGNRPRLLPSEQRVRVACAHARHFWFRLL